MKLHGILHFFKESSMKQTKFNIVMFSTDGENQKNSMEQSSW